MPIHLERCDYDFDITISFRLENLQNVFEASEDPEYLYTDRFKFGPGWKLRLKWTCEEDDVYLSMKLKPGPGHMGKSIDWTVTGESSSGARYFHCSDTYTVVSSGFRWRRLLSLDDHWERYKGLRHENAVLITARFHSPSGPNARSREVSGVLYRGMANMDTTDVKFISFGSRTRSGRLYQPRTILADLNVLIAHSPYMQQWFDVLDPDMSSSILEKVNEDIPIQEILASAAPYMDHDSDFEGDDVEERFPDKATMSSPVWNYDHSETLSAAGLAHDLIEANVDGKDFLICSSDEHTSIRPIEADEPSMEDQEVESDRQSSSDSLSIRGHITIPVTLVVGAASPTWHAFILYLYTGKVSFAPLHSEGEQVREQYVLNYRRRYPDLPIPCSCKSMYRLADKLGMRNLKELSLQHLAFRLSANSILTEILSKFTSRFEEVRRVELAVLKKYWDELKGTQDLKDTLIEITDGWYPHASGVVAEMMENMYM